MTRPRTPASLGRTVAAPLLVLGLLAGCGGTPPPAQEVAGLGTSLDRVDTAVVGGRYDEARAGLDALVRQTRTAQDDGRISGDQAAAILAAVAELRDALPDSSQPSPTSSSTSSSSSTTTTSGSTGTATTSGPGKGKGHDNGVGNDNGNGNGQGHG